MCVAMLFQLDSTNFLCFENVHRKIYYDSKGKDLYMLYDLYACGKYDTSTGLAISETTKKRCS